MHISYQYSTIVSLIVGVIFMFAAILVLLALPVLDSSRIRGIAFKPVMKFVFWVFVANFITLMVLGAKHVETPYIELGQICTFLYFAWFILLIPVVNTFENVLTVLGSPLTIKGSLDEAGSGSASKPLYPPFGWNLLRRGRPPPFPQV